MARKKTARGCNPAHAFSQRRSAGGMSRRLMIEPLEVRALLSLGLTPCGTWTQLAPSGAAPVRTTARLLWKTRLTTG